MNIPEQILCPEFGVGIYDSKNQAALAALQAGIEWALEHRI